MSMIAVSRETGSLGDDIAQILAKHLGYSLLDRNALEESVNGKDFPEISVDKYDEHSPSFWENFNAGKDIYLDRLRTAMLESASGGQAVILGRGSQFILGGVPGVFRVRIIAGLETRVARLMGAMSWDRKTAERHCRKSDHDRVGFSRFFFGGHWSDPASYDLTLCTDALDASGAADVISAAYKASSISEADSGTVLKDRLLAQSVRNRILYTKRIPVDLLEVECDSGRVIVRGTVTVKENADRCKDAAESVDGVESVNAEVYFVNPVLTY